MIAFECKRCGKCCVGDMWLRSVITQKDIDKWKQAGRHDILQYVCSGCGRVVDPEAGHGAAWKKEECPFLERHDGRAMCRIYDARPDTCVRFPLNECENPKCEEKYHFHQWVWQGNCEAAAVFRRDVIRAIENDIAMGIGDNTNPNS